MGAAIGGAVLQPQSPSTFEAVLVINALTQVVFGCLLVWTGETNPSRSPAAPVAGGYRRVLNDRALLATVALNGLIVIAAFGQITSAFAAWATKAAHTSTSVVGWAWTANTFTIVIAQLFVLRFVGGYRRTRATAGAALLFGLCWLVTLAGGVIDGALGAAGLIVALAIFGPGETLLSPSMPPMVNDLAPDALRGRYNAIYNLSWQSGLVIGPALAGFVLARGWGVAYFASLAACCGLAAADSATRRWCRSRAASDASAPSSWRCRGT